MSRGSPIVKFRIPERLLAMIDADVQRSIQEDDWPRSTRTAWILDAIERVFRQRGRADKQRARNKARRENASLADANGQFNRCDEEERE